MTDPGWPLAAALAAGDQRAFAAALEHADLAVPSDGAGGIDVKRDRRDRRVLLAFTHPAALELFDVAQAVGTVHGSDLAARARELGVAAVLLDPAGPAPVELTVEGLEALTDAIVDDGSGGLRLTGPGNLEADPALRDRLVGRLPPGALPVGAAVVATARLTPRGVVPTIVVDRADVAHALIAELPKLVDAGRVADVVMAAPELLLALAERLPEAVLLT